MTAKEFLKEKGYRDSISECMEEYLEAYKQSQWIPVSEMLPLVPMHVIAYRNISFTKPGVIGLYFDSNNRFRYGEQDYTNYVTHWQPLPSPPKA